MNEAKDIKGLDFYSLLMTSIEFTSELGKVALISGRLEAELKLLLIRNKVFCKLEKLTLGALIDKAHKNSLLSQNEVEAFKTISKQRNYLTHNIYSLFNYQIEETILERENLLDSDINLYTERAWVLNDNLLSLAELVKKKK